MVDIHSSSQAKLDVSKNINIDYTKRACAKLSEGAQVLCEKLGITSRGRHTQLYPSQARCVQDISIDYTKGACAKLSEGAQVLCENIQHYCAAVLLKSSFI